MASNYQPTEFSGRSDMTNYNNAMSKAQGISQSGLQTALRDMWDQKQNTPQTPTQTQQPADPEDIPDSSSLTSQTYGINKPTNGAKVIADKFGFNQQLWNQTAQQRNMSNLSHIGFTV